MSKALNIIGAIFIFLVLALAVVLVVFRLQIFSYLNRINNVSDTVDKSNLDIDKLNINLTDGSSTGSLDLSIINSQKFKDLEAVKFDASLYGGGNSSTSSSTDVFPIGNSDPFKAF